MQLRIIVCLAGLSLSACSTMPAGDRITNQIQTITDAIHSPKSDKSAMSPARPHSLSNNLLIYSSSANPRFFEPPKDVSVNYKLLQADFHLFNGKFTFRLDGTQRMIHLECGLSDYGPRGANQLRVVGDGRDLSSSVYNAGKDAVASHIDTQGVQALTFILSGTIPGDFYCKDTLSY